MICVFILQITSTLWLTILINFIAIVISDDCIGNEDKDVQLQTAIQYTKTREFNELFEGIRISDQWQELKSYAESTFKIDIEEILQNADPQDTLSTFKNGIERSIPLIVKIQFVLAPASLDIQRGNILFYELNALPETEIIKEELCALNVNFNDIASALM